MASPSPSAPEPKAAGGLIRSSAIYSGLTLISRFLGLARDLVITARLGASQTIAADAYYTALTFPNLFRRMFAEGAFAAAFVPMFAGTVAQHGKQAAKEFAESAMAVLLAVLFVLVVAAEFAMPWVVAVIAPGFADEPQRYALAVDFTRVTFPYLLFISLVALQGGVLNSLDRFAAVAATPILLNLCLIGAIFGFTPFMPSAGHALSWGVALAGLAQFLFLAWPAGAKAWACVCACPNSRPRRGP